MKLDAQLYFEMSNNIREMEKMKLIGLSGALAGSKTAKVVHGLLIHVKEIQQNIQTFR